MRKIGEWFKSSYSGDSANDTACVELRLRADGGYDLRDSKNPDGPVLNFTEREMRAFVLGARAGEFDTV